MDEGRVALKYHEAKEARNFLRPLANLPEYAIWQNIPLLVLTARFDEPYLLFAR